MNKRNIKKIEKVFKGGANHYRIELLVLIDKNPDITLSSLVDIMDVAFKTLAQHLYKLYLYGLINKIYNNQRVMHRLSDSGKKVVRFIKSWM